MCSFEPRFSLKLTKNTQVTLQTKRQYFFACILLLSLAGHWIYGQGSDNLNTATSTIGISSALDTIPDKSTNTQLDTIVQDTIHVDEIEPVKIGRASCRERG